MQRFRTKEIIFEYNLDVVAFQLKVVNNGYELVCSNIQNGEKSIGDKATDVKELFYTIEDFWVNFTSDKNWFSKFIKINFNKIFIKHIVKTHNDLLADKELSYAEHKALYGWIRMCLYTREISNTVLAQYCSKCKKKVPYNPRYPKKICVDCLSCEITDSHGKRISFSNIDFSGGLKVLWWENDKIVKEDSTQITKLCYINKVAYIASEHRFGGIVIQKKV